MLFFKTSTKYLDSDTGITWVYTINLFSFRVLFGSGGTLFQKDYIILDSLDIHPLGARSTELPP